MGSGSPSWTTTTETQSQTIQSVHPWAPLFFLSSLLPLCFQSSSAFTYGIELSQPGLQYYWYLRKPGSVLIFFFLQYQLAIKVPVLLKTLLFHHFEITLAKASSNKMVKSSNKKMNFMECKGAIIRGRKLELCPP